MMRLRDKIELKKAKIGVVGLGYVGLPLALLCGQKGYQVLGVDYDEKKVASLENGDSYITDIYDEDIVALLARKTLYFTSNYEEIPSCDIIFVCVPTPLGADKKPDFSFLFAAIASLGEKLRPGQLVVVESTVTPGTTMSELLPRLAVTGLKVGEDFYLAFSPERIDPANTEYRLENIPKLVAGVTPCCQKLCLKLYQSLGIPTVPVSSPAIAEMAKLLENTYRDVNIAFINEMAAIAQKTGIDIWEVIGAAATKPFGFLPFYPGPGVGGHCIPKDSAYYINWAREKGTPALLAEHARTINTSRPQYVVQRFQDLMTSEGKLLAGSKILVLGVTYKKDVNDIRESPAIKIIELLTLEGALVSYHDPFIKELWLRDRAWNSIELDEKAIAQFDCVDLAVPHSSYGLAWLSETAPLIFDLTNATEAICSRRCRIQKL